MSRKKRAWRSRHKTTRIQVPVRDHRKTSARAQNHTFLVLQWFHQDQTIQKTAWSRRMASYKW